MNGKTRLIGDGVSTKVKIAALWTTAMFLYAYADIMHFALQPGSVEGLLRGELEGVEITGPFLMGAAALMIVSALMISLTVLLSANASRRLNVVMGIVLTLVTIGTMVVPSDSGRWGYYLMYNVVEIALTLVVAYLAWTWPREQVVATQVGPEPA